MPTLPEVAIFMYHKVGVPIEQKADTFLNVATDDFRRQMQTLRRLGYQSRTFGQVVEAWREKSALPPRTCVITFDDAYTNVWENAYPVLKECGMVGTLFVVSQAIGKTNAWDHINEKRCLTIMNAQALETLIAEGWEIAGHTCTHPHLDKLEDSEALTEIRQGKEELETQFGILLKTFCYPYGHLNERTPELVKEVGYIAACTTQSGIATPTHNPFLIPRIKIAYRDHYWGFLYRLLLNHRLPEIRRQRRSRVKRAVNPQ